LTCEESTEIALFESFEGIWSVCIQFRRVVNRRYSGRGLLKFDAEQRFGEQRHLNAMILQKGFKTEYAPVIESN